MNEASPNRCHAAPTEAALGGPRVSGLVFTQPMEQPWVSLQPRAIHRYELADHPLPNCRF
jgi:hypothetical protein